MDGTKVTLGGIAKGSGMIHPNMATMLGLVTCDAAVEASVWTEMLKRAVARSFNVVRFCLCQQLSCSTQTTKCVCPMHAAHRMIPLPERRRHLHTNLVASASHNIIASAAKVHDTSALHQVRTRLRTHIKAPVPLLQITVDGDTSTNDTVLGLASGAAGNPTITDASSSSGAKLEGALTATLQGLAKSVAWDGEGATCLLQVKCVGAQSEEDALLAAKSVAASSLTKAAIYGHDPNWGRIACATGYSGA